VKHAVSLTTIYRLERYKATLLVHRKIPLRATAPPMLLQDEEYRVDPNDIVMMHAINEYQILNFNFNSSSSLLHSSQTILGRFLVLQIIS